MLRIKGDIAGLIKAAQTTGSLEALTTKLDYLNRWGDDAQYTVQVDAYVYEGDKEASLRFLNKDGETMMVGGLVYHASDNSWGVHT